jgi:hypothetical protein
MTVHALAPDASMTQLLPGAQFADTFRIATGNASLTTARRRNGCSSICRPGSTA